MKVLWSLERGTVREIFESLRKDREIAYTTVLTMVKVLERKGHVRKDEEGRAPIYAPVGSRQSAVAHMVSEFVDRVFNGAAAPLLLHLAAHRKLSAKDRAEIARLLQEKEK